MLVTFKTSAYSDITMFGSAAVALLRMMGQSGNVPGAILAADIPQALQNLQDELTRLGSEERQGEGVSEPQSDTAHQFDESEDNQTVGLHTRAGPLVSLLEAAAQAEENVQWDS